MAQGNVGFQQNAWSDLRHDVQTDKIPPQWFPGCGVKLADYIVTLGEWKVFANYDNDAAKLVALKTRSKGTVHTLIKAMPISGEGAWDNVVNLSTDHRHGHKCEHHASQHQKCQAPQCIYCERAPQVNYSKNPRPLI